MDIKKYRENIKTRKDAMVNGVLGLIQSFEEETGCTVESIALTHVDAFGANKTTVGVFANINVLGDQDY